MKIYFAGSIRGGRDDRGRYLKIINHLQKYGTVLTEHVGGENISAKGEENLSEKEIYDRDITWLNSANVVVAEVSNPSLGVGYEIAYSENAKKKILCLYKIRNDKKLSAMIEGSSSVNVRKYNKLDEALKNIDIFFSKLNY